jgi:hypothetical protein
VGVAAFRNFVSEEEAAELCGWALNLRDKGVLHANIIPSRRFARIRDLADLPPLFFELRERAANMLRMTNPADRKEPAEHMFTSYVSVITEGGAVQAHTDPEPEGCRHIRFNILVSKPDAGGMPVIGDTRIDVSERGGWFFFPNKYMHSCESVEGDKPRILIGYGFLVDNRDGGWDQFKPGR